MNYLLELRDTVEEYKIKGKDKFNEEEYEKAKEKYLSILDRWTREHTNTSKKKPKYYENEKCLVRRLKEYVKYHLRFTTDFRIDFTNNLVERGLRKVKTKLKIAGGFRNLNFAKYYCHAITIIDKSSDALKREFKEEIGANITVKDFLGVSENIFTYQEKKAHELIFLYFIEIPDYNYKKEYCIVDDKNNYKAKWINVDEFKNGTKILYPKEVLKYI